jgi:hypothetical protein
LIAAPASPDAEILESPGEKSKQVITSWCPVEEFYQTVEAIL